MRLIWLGLVALHVRIAESVIAPHRSLAQVKRSERCMFDYSDLDAVLRKFVAKKAEAKSDKVRATTFDYVGLLDSDSDLKKLDKYVKSLASFEPSCLSSDGKLAFWINTYNALIINFIVKHVRSHNGNLPKSIIDLKGSEDNVWACKAGTVGGKELTLEEVLTEGAKLGDPRIHAGVNCASLSCPDIRSSAYSEENIQKELDTQVTNWLINAEKGVAIDMVNDIRQAVKDTKSRLLVSKIFHWHSADFPSVTAFVAPTLGFPKETLEVVGYLTYNWDLNAAPNATFQKKKAIKEQKLLRKANKADDVINKEEAELNKDDQEAKSSARSQYASAGVMVSMAALLASF